MTNQSYPKDPCSITLDEDGDVAHIPTRLVMSEEAISRMQKLIREAPAPSARLRAAFNRHVLAALDICSTMNHY